MARSGLTLGPPFPFVLGRGGLVLPRAARRTFYLASDGSDANPGTSVGAAWQTLQHAASRVWEPGEELVIVDGQSGIDDPIDFVGGGDPANPVVIRGMYPGDKPLLSFAAAMSESPKLNVAGVGFVVLDIRVTQATKGSTASDRMVVAQTSQDGTSTPSDVVFRNVTASNGYELFKASGQVARIRFVGCTGHTATIAGGIVGAADDCSFEFGTFYNSSEGLQAKGGCRNPLILGNTFINAFANGAIGLGGSSTINDGSGDWWRDDGYECANGLAVANLVRGSAGGPTPSAIRLRGALDCRAAYNTLINPDAVSHYTNGIEDGFTIQPSGGSGWTGGAPDSDGCVIEQNVLQRITTTVYTRNSTAGSHAYRDNTHYLCDWVTTAGDLTGTVTMSGLASRDPKLASLTTGELAADSPERGAGSPLSHAWFGGSSPHEYALDLLQRARGASAWHRGAMETP